MLPLTPYGTRELIIGTLLLIVIAILLALVSPYLALLTLPLFAFLYNFFRDPNRKIPTDANVMVSPADGTVSDVLDIDHMPALNGPAVRVGIFLSVFDVHVNRAPCDAIVGPVEYKKGKFINALKHADASAHNEANTVLLLDPATRAPIAVVRQIVGLIARRIIFPNVTGDTLTRGQHIGMMKFGSRTELYVPKSLRPTVLVKVGDKVKGGSDILIKLG